jgi:hypothetical protein
MLTNASVLLGIALGLLGRSTNSPRDGNYRAFVDKCMTYLTAHQDETFAAYNLHSFKRYFWSQDEGTLVFSNGGDPIVIAQIQCVGDVSKLSKTWLWAWANPTVIPKMKPASERVRDYGSEMGYKPLVQAKWPADVVDGWEMTAVTAYLMHAIGAYRTEADHGYQYMIITSVRWADPDRKGSPH